MTDASMEINVSYTNWRNETSVRRVLLGDVRFGTTEWHEEPTWLIKAFDLDHPAQIWKEFDLLKCDFNREEIGKNARIAELEEGLTTINSCVQQWQDHPRKSGTEILLELIKDTCGESLRGERK
jgi:hypothetical protein